MGDRLSARQRIGCVAFLVLVGAAVLFGVMLIRQRTVNYDTNGQRAAPGDRIRVSGKMFNDEKSKFFGILVESVELLNR